jgi:nucleotide-binding universal stress UspA family protein
MEELIGPIIYVREPRLPVRKLLISIGGLGYEVTAEHIAMQVAMKSQATITLLHVVPPVDLDYPTARAERTGWQHLADTDTPVGRSLRQAMEIADQEGLSVIVKGRRGNVVEEILAEIREGDYDLLCMGSPYSADAFRQLYTPNVTAEVAEAAGIPVLTARFKKE